MSRYIPDELRSEVIARSANVCAYCGRRCGLPGRRELEIDHVIPVASNGSNTANNLVVACRQCNRSKGAKQGWRWTPKPVFVWIMLRNIMYIASLLSFAMSAVMFLQDDLYKFVTYAVGGIILVSIGWLRF